VLVNFNMLVSIMLDWIVSNINCSFIALIQSHGIKPKLSRGSSTITFQAHHEL